ncbi:MAG: UPF0175 family protein [Cytophagales bacterium]|nr:MAG: UPF0175 family protein [Cytophagales bacterium]
MKTLTINLPDSIENEDTNLIFLFSALLYEKGKLSMGQAAEVAGLSKRTFIEMIGKQNISLFNFPSSDLKLDVANA